MSRTVEVHIGVIGRPHGIRGDVVVESRTDEPDRRFAEGARLRTSAGRELTVQASRWHSGRLLIRFAELADRSEVERARGWTLMADVPVDEQPDEDGEYYDRQLIDLQVRNAAGTGIGRIRSVIHLSAQDLLEIETPDGRRLVPFVTALVPTVDLARRFVQLAEVPGLLTDLPEHEPGQPQFEQAQPEEAQPDEAQPESAEPGQDSRR